MQLSIPKRLLADAEVRIALTRFAPVELYPDRITFGSEAVAEILFRNKVDASLMTAMPAHPGK